MLRPGLSPEVPAQNLAPQSRTDPRLWGYFFVCILSAVHLIFAAFHFPAHNYEIPKVSTDYRARSQH